MTKYTNELSKALDIELDEYDSEKDEDELDEPIMPEIDEDTKNKKD